MLRNFITLQELGSITGWSGNMALKAAELRIAPTSILGGRRQCVRPAESRKILESLGYAFSRKIIVIQTNKGGTGKTVLTKNIGIRASMIGYRVLFVDFDSQSNLTHCLGVESGNRYYWSNYLRKQCAIDDLVLSIGDNTGIIPCSLSESVLSEILPKLGKNLLVNCIAEPLRSLNSQWDLVICDCPPVWDHLAVAILIAADRILIPIFADAVAKIIIEKTIDNFDGLQKNIDREMDFAFLINRFDERKREMKDQFMKISSMREGLIHQHYVSDSTEIATSMNPELHLWSNCFSSKSAIEIDKIVKDELLRERA